MSTPANSVQAPNYLPGVGNAAQNFGAEAGSLGNFNLFDPTTASSLSYGVINNPFQQGYSSGANVAGGMGELGGLNTFTAGQNLYGTGNTLGANVLANNPQGQQPLYNYLFNQNQQQANAENAMAGVATTPYGAGVTNQSDQLFNLNWQNFLQQQQLQAAQGQQAAYGAGSQMQQQAPVQYLTGASTPYGVANTIAGTGMQALGGLQGYGIQGAQIPEQQAQLQGNYALGGQQANTSLFGQQLNQANFGWQEAMAPWQGLGQIAGLGLGGFAQGYGRGLGSQA